MTKKADYLVVDSGGFIKNAPLRDLASTIITLQEVVGEIRDKETRKRLQVLPYELVFRQPSGEAIKKVSDFAKKTGDYASLSLTDLRVLAVTYDLEVSQVGASHLRTEPVVNKTTEFYKPVTDRAKLNKADSKIAGFYNGDNMGEECNEDIAEVEDAEEDVTEVSKSFDSFSYWREPMEDIVDSDLLNTEQENVTEISENFDSFNYWREPVQDIVDIDFLDTDTNLHDKLSQMGSNVKTYTQHSNDHSDSEDFLDNSSHDDEDRGYDSDKENDENEEDDDEDGWITPGNVQHKKKAFSGEVQSAVEKTVAVACMTTDFAMQNVLKQIGLNILGTDGMVIKETKTWILRCYGCFFTTPLMDKKFCPKCGNKTLKRVSVTVNRDGSQQIHISTRRPINTKGKKFSLPAPKGGKHGVNPRLVADQREAQQRISKKAMAKNNPMDEDYMANNSPFITKDTTSKSAMMGLHGRGKGNAEVPGAYWARRNPNAVKKNTGNKRKKVP